MATVDNLLLKTSAQGMVARTAKLQQMKRRDSNNAICDDLAGWPQGEAVAISIYQVDSKGVPDENSITDWVAEVNNNTLINMKLTGGVDRDYDSLNTVVAVNFTSEWANRLASALLKILNQDGTLKEIDGSKIKDSSLDGSKIKPSSVKPAHLSSSIITISGSNEYTTDNNSTVKLDKVSSQVGDSLSLSDNSIIVGTGVSKILVSANIFIKTTTPTGYAWGTLKKNNINLGLNTIASVSGNFCSLSISPVLIDVSQGDKITAEFFDAPGGGDVQIRGAHSWLTAQVVA